MVKKHKTFKVVKVPLDYFPNSQPANFPPMPILYLELLENKDKVKKEFRNKDYIPPQERIMESNIPTTNQAESQNQTYQEIDKDFVIQDYSSEYPEQKSGFKKREPLKILDLSEPKEKRENELNDYLFFVTKLFTLYSLKM